MTAKPIPEGYTSVMPYLTAGDGEGSDLGPSLGPVFPVKAALVVPAAVAFFVVCS